MVEETSQGEETEMGGSNLCNKETAQERTGEEMEGEEGTENKRSKDMEVQGGEERRNPADNRSRDGARKRAREIGGEQEESMGTESQEKETP